MANISAARDWWKEIGEVNETIARVIAESPLREWAVYLLSNVPGLPPITQAFHIMGIGAVVGSSVILDLRILGIAVPSQNLGEMIRRLMPWTWWALLVNVTTGGLFILARPYRYFLNPVFGIKVSMLLPAIVLGLVIFLLGRREAGFWEASPGRRAAAKAIAGVSLLLWIGVIMAGRWIAYSDYLFYPE